MGQGGLLKGRSWPRPSASCGPNDLVWNYVVGNYLKGETPPPFDLLYWNSDATNLPGPMYCLVPAQHLPREQPRQAGRAAPCAARRSTCGKHRRAGLHLRLARRPHRADRRRLCLDPAAAGQEALRDGRVGPHRRRDQPAGQEKAQPLDARRRQAARPRRPNGSTAPPSTRAAGGPTGRAGSRRHAGKQIAAPKAYGKGSDYKAIEPAPGRYVKAQGLTTSISSIQSQHRRTHHGRHRHRFGRPHRRRQVRRLARQDSRDRAGRAS